MKVHFKIRPELVLGGLFALTLLLYSTSTHAALSQSISLNGSSQYLSISNAAQTGLGFTGNNTVEGWVYLTSAPTMGQMFALFAKYDAAGSQRGYLYTYENNGGTMQIVARISSNGSSVSTGSLNVTIPTNTWTHVALVYDTSGTVNVIINGTSQGTITSLANSIFSNTADVTVGYQPNIGPGYFPGNFSLVREWNTNLSASTINANKCTVFGSAQTNLQAEWSLDGVLTDASGNGNTLTNNGSASFASSIPPCLAVQLAVRKTSTQTISNSSTLQNDSQLTVSLAASKTYIVDGVVFAAATTTSATPDIILGFTAPSGSVLIIGAGDDMLTASGSASPRIALPPGAALPVYIHGTIVTSGTSGDLQLQWAQSTANSAPTSVLAGSYLKVEEVQ